MPGLKIELTNLEQTISITTSINSPIEAVVMDSWQNRKNTQSSDLCKHQAYIPMDTLEHYHEIGERTITYNIPADRLSLTRFYGVYFIQVLFKDDALNSQCADNQTIIYSEDMMYGFRWHLMNKTCIPCMDLNNYQLLELLMFRELMFRDAVKLGRIDDAIYYFNEIIRVVQDCTQVFDDISFKRCLDGSFGCHLNIGLDGTDYPNAVCFK